MSAGPHKKPSAAGSSPAPATNPLRHRAHALVSDGPRLPDYVRAVRREMAVQA